MNVNDPTAHSAAEDLSDKSNSSNSETQLHAFQEYGKIKELNLSINRAKDLSPNKTKDFSFALDGNHHRGLSVSSLAVDRSAKDLPVALDKSKEFDFQPEKIKDVSSYSLDRSQDTDASLDTAKEYTPNLNRTKDKDVIFSFDGIKDVHFPRESKDARTKNIHFPVDRNKDLNFPKGYNHPLDRIKDFNFALDRRRDSHVAGLALERLRGGSFLEPTDYRNPQIPPRDELEAIAMERMRRSHILTSDIGPRNLPAHLPHPHSITEMQHSQQQQQQQGKSFTIDSILGLRNNQRDKQQRSQQHPYRKHQGQEGSAKNGSSGSSSSSGKLKRVRTIFTAEQLERLEGEFARQQYMVGPERLYLAHALRLTEAQVKVWFQNRRIKWRKLHHEQQSQRLHELHSLSSLEPDVEDSNDNIDCRDVFKPDFPKAGFSGHPFLGELETTLFRRRDLRSLRIACRRSRTIVSQTPKTLDTISEHTEPSPVPSTTMDQADLETQSQTRKLPRGRHSTSYWPPWASRLPADGTSASDSYWKTAPRPTHSVPHSHEQRRQDYGVSEPVTTCYSVSNTYKPKHRALTSVLPKPPRVSTSDQTYRASQHSARTARNKLLTTNNVAVVRKTCYKDDVEEDEDVKYDEEDVNYAEENADDEVADEVDEDQEETYEYNDKEYEEQEADDEVDDESDAFQTQLHRLQHKVQKPPNHNAQQLKHTEQQQDLRKIQRQQHIQKMYQDQKLPRYYQQVLDTQQRIGHDTSYGDAAEVISDDQHPAPWTPDARKSSRRMSETHHAIPSWTSARKSLERNRDRFTSSLDQQRHQRQCQHLQQLQQQQQQQQHQHQHQHQQLRKLRTMKPEIESLMMPPQPSNPTGKKCYICEGSTNPVRKGNCRLHEYKAITVKGPPGEDGEAKEEVICGRCAKVHNMEEFRLGCEASSQESPSSHYAAKRNQSRIHHHRPSSYDCPDDSQAVDEFLAAYSSGQPRTNTLDYAMAPRERTRHSVQSARSPSRRSNYYNER